MAIAPSSAPATRFCCTTRPESAHRRFPQPVLPRTGPNFQSRVAARHVIVSHLNASSDEERVYELSHNNHRRRIGPFPVYVKLPADAVDPTAETMRRKKIMTQSFLALAKAGVEGVVMEVWWGLVEREYPKCYNWGGYLEIVEMARRFGLKVRALIAFHQCNSGPDVWIRLPLWVVEAMDRDPDVAYSDWFGRRNKEYISLGCDTLPVLHGRTPVQAYADLMRNFRDTFGSFLGETITGIQVGLGPDGELRYPSCPTHKLSWPWRARELGQFQCYDKYMLAALNACAREVGMSEWENAAPIGTSSSMQNPEQTEFFRSNGTWKTPYGEFFLGWYSGMLLLHGERICREAESIFRHNEVSLSGKIAGIHWHYGTQSHPSELTSGYYNTSVRDGYTTIVRMFSRYGFSVCCSCFEMRDALEQEINPTSSPETFVKHIIDAARMCDVPLEGENYSKTLDDESFGQVLKMTKSYSDGLETPTFSFNFGRMDRSLFEERNWVSFTRFVRQMSAVGMFQVSADSGGGELSSSFSAPSASAFAGGVLAH